MNAIWKQFVELMLFLNERGCDLGNKTEINIHNVLIKVNWVTIGPMLTGFEFALITSVYYKFETLMRLIRIHIGVFDLPLTSF